MAGSQSHNRNASQSLRANESDNDSVIGSIVDVGFRRLWPRKIAPLTFQ